MRKSDWGRNIPVFIISNLNESDAPAGIRGMGIEGYAVKANLSNDELDKLVDSILTPPDQNEASLDVNRNQQQQDHQPEEVQPQQPPQNPDELSVHHDQDDQGQQDQQYQQPQQ
ncbi:MAG: hypothetical protein WDN66_05170 [Candidatus Saccharibacteria bacterium]